MPPGGFEDLHSALVQRYDLEELRTLCARLQVSFDSLRGEGLQAKARELLLLMQRRGQQARIEEEIGLAQPAVLPANTLNIGKEAAYAADSEDSSGPHHDKVSDLLVGQAAILLEVRRSQHEILARISLSEQRVVAGILEHLDETELRVLDSVVTGLETLETPAQEAQELLASLLNALERVDLEILGIASEELRSILINPQLDLKSKLKLTVPIIPILLNLETELELSAIRANLVSAWQRFRDRLTGKEH